MRLLLQRFSKDQSGATAIEYGLIASLIFVVIAGSIALLGGGSNGLYTRIGNAIVPVLDKALGTGDSDGDAPDTPENNDPA